MAMAADFAITEARDWPMFVFLLSFIGVLMASLAGFICYVWRDLKSDLRVRCSDRNAQCERQREKIWSAIDDCCPRHGGHQEGS